MPQFTQAQLDVFWQQYVGMNVEQLRIALTPGQDGFLGSTWSSMLDYVIANRLYGFANYVPLPGHTAGENAGSPRSIAIYSGPTKS